MKTNFSPAEFEIVKKYFNNVESSIKVEYTKNGNIRIINLNTCDCVTSWPKNPAKKWYVIGKNKNGYWIRRVKYDLKRKESNSVFPLHYDRKTSRYEFETFAESLIYFVNSVEEFKIGLLY